jgi:hypothetical protein
MYSTDRGSPGGRAVDGLDPGLVLVWHSGLDGMS